MSNLERLLLETKITRVRYYCSKCGADITFDNGDVYSEKLECGCPAHNLRQVEVEAEAI